MLHPLTGDSRQTLPVVKHANRAATVLALLKNSYLWTKFNVFTFSVNVRVLGQNLTQHLQDHAQWLLQLGNNTAPSVDDIESSVSGGKWIKIPEHMRLETEQDLYDHVYGDLQNATNDPSAYFSARALMAPLNRCCKRMNAFMTETWKTLFPNQVNTSTFNT